MGGQHKHIPTFHAEFLGSLKQLNFASLVHSDLELKSLKKNFVASKPLSKQQ